jgi:hypothetical protein
MRASTVQLTRFNAMVLALAVFAASATAQIGPASGGSSSGGSAQRGPQGLAGNSVLNGSGTPVSGTGNNGDFYLRTDTNCLYGPKISGAWPGSCTSLIGPAGTAGATGNTILNGLGAPTSGAGNNGDFYLRTDTMCVYGPKSAGTWPGSCVSMVGPPGPSGALSGLTPGAIVAAATASSVNTPGASATVDGGGNITANSVTSTGTGTGNLTMQFGTAPANPAAGNALLYADSSTGTLTCHNSSGANCMPAASIPATTVQTNQSNAYTTGTQDFTLATHMVAKNGTAANKPGSCTTGEVYFATDATPGQNWYFCTAINTWSQQVAGGSGGAAAALVDGAANNALTVTQGSGTIVNYLTVANAPTGTSPQLQSNGGDANINLTLAPKGTGTVVVPSTNLVTSGASAPALLALGGNTTGNTFGVMMAMNLPSGASNAEYLRMSNNAAWQASLQGGGAWLSSGISTGSTSSGTVGAAYINNAGQHIARNLGMYAITSGTTASTSSIDVALARNAAGVFEINSGSSGPAAASAIRDLKLRHMVASGTAPALTTGTGSIAGADETGRITLAAASQTSVVISFGTSYANAPACVANDETTAILVQAVASATQLTLNGSFGSADKLTWRCGGY